MIDHQNKPDNTNRDLDRPAQAERSESSGSAADAATGYYYDDSTGYEVYDDKDEDEGEEE